MAQDPKVLVVGAGPTGLMLASELYRKGVPCRIIDMAPEPHPLHLSKALGIHARTMELLEEIGIADQILEKAMTLKGAEVRNETNELLAAFTFELLKPLTKHPYALMLQQPVTERILEKHLNKLGGTVEYGTKLISLHQDADGVDVVLERDGKEEKARYAYVCGTDGAHSVVRKQLGFTFDGNAYKEHFSLADLQVKWEFSHEKVLLWNAAHFMLVAFPLPEQVTGGPYFYRFVVDEFEQNTTATEGVSHGFITNDVDLDHFKKFLLHVCPNIEVLQTTWKTAFNISHRLVSKYGEGRVFIGGDAAHIHSPAGGQGMNTGLQDAYNLAWKLALVVKGSSPASLLDSYEPERREIAKEVLASTDRLTNVVAMKSELGQKVRDRMMAFLSPLSHVQHAFVENMSQVHVAYKSSPIVVDTSVNMFGQSHAKVLPGARAEDAVLADNSRLYKHIWDGVSNKHCVLLFCNSTKIDQFYAQERIALQLLHHFGNVVDVKIVLPQSMQSQLEAKKVVKPPIQILYDGNDHGVFEVYGTANETSSYVIRPDGYVGHFAKHADAEVLRNYLGSLFVQ